VDLDWAHTILEPHFDAVRDAFACFVPEGYKKPLERLGRVRYVMSPDMHDSERHYAATRTDGTLMLFAPEIVELPLDTMVAILGHEFGHAADFAYPGCWTWPFGRADKSYWVGAEPARKAMAWRTFFGSRKARSRTEHDDAEPAAHWMRAWEDRSNDCVEWAADGICEAVTGRRPRYCGDCLVQCFAPTGIDRPSGLR
jgi:hypothetical protein